jgi:hypothetical protein
MSANHATARGARRVGWLSLASGLCIRALPDVDAFVIK